MNSRSLSRNVAGVIIAAGLLSGCADEDGAFHTLAIIVAVVDANPIGFIYVIGGAVALVLVVVFEWQARAIPDRAKPQASRISFEDLIPKKLLSETDGGFRAGTAGKDDWITAPKPKANR
jgi:hypothetical protein